MTARDPRIVELESEGYVVLKAASYRKAQERQATEATDTEFGGKPGDPA